MSEKHSSPLLESSPRPDSSSSDDEELKDAVVVVEKEKANEEKEEDENEENKEEEEANEEEEEDENENENEEEEEEDDDSGGFTVKKHVAVVTNPNPQPQSPSSSSSSIGDEEEADSELESDSDLQPPPPPENISKSSDNTDVDPTTVEKPITTSIITMDASAKQKQKLKKKISTTTTTTTTDQKPKTSGTVTPMKRTASETTDKLEEVSKKRNKIEKKSSSTGKLHWSEDDEVVILKGLLSLMSKKVGTAAKPISEMINELFENIKPSLQVDHHVTRDQLYGKIRKLKQRYVKAKTHDSKILKLSNKIWGGTTSVKGEETTEAINGVLDSAAAAKKELEGKSTTRSHRSKADNAVVSPKQQLSNEVPSFFNEVIESGKNSIVPPEGLKRFLTKEALGLIGSSKAKDLEEKWNELQIAEAKIYLDRINLVKEQVELVLDAIGGTEE